jgi:polyisoprenoid-binding protein YceI
VVDSGFVEFDAITGSGTWVGYRIDEELRGFGEITAVGRSPRVEGRVVIDGSSVTSATIGADLQALRSNNANRDSWVSPIFVDRPVVFTLSRPVDFGAVPSEGQRVAVSAEGVLRIGDIERDVVVELSADVAGTRLFITGSTVVTLRDFDVSVPSVPIVLSVADDATIELALFLSRG